jgi:antirestriction protein ArdC
MILIPREANDDQIDGCWIGLLKADKRAIFTACSRAKSAADYLRGLALQD